MSKINPSGAEVETKVAAAGGYGAATMLITWFLTNTIFKGHVPADMATMLPGLVSVVAGTAAGWLSHHTPRPAEVAATVQKALGGSAAVQPASVDIAEVTQAVIDALSAQGLAPVPARAGNVAPAPEPAPAAPPASAA